MAKKKKEGNPFFTKDLAWLWLVFFPIALAGSVIYYSNLRQEKKAKKRAKREEEFFRKYPEFYMWQDNQGL